jgi:oligopeptide/dipeptide ABC transporter ATP-binding protein
VSGDTPIIEVRSLVKHFAQGRYTGRKVVHALNGVDIAVRKGETLGIVGETGCGKSTLVRVMMRLYTPTAGRVYFEGTDITHLRERRLGFVRRKMQMIFQDPADSMNSRLTVGYIIEEPLLIQTRMSAAARREKSLALLRDVGLPEESYARYPHEFSGGQRQRIAVARALAVDPEVVVCDEPVSALDVSVQSQILNLLLEMQREHALTMIFVSHALSVVRHMSDRVAVLYLGSVMELADSRTIYEAPRHPYTQALIAAIPRTDPGARKERVFLSGEVPSPITLPPGCPFYSNCPIHIALCLEEKPPLRELGDGHFCACHLAR